jgi:rSAM/selenodomain-associated transferase 1
MRFPEARLLMMAKAPLAGLAKTRLIPALGEEGAAQLQRYLIERQLQQSLTGGLAPVELWGAGQCDHPLFCQLQRRYDITLRCQQGADLGERIAHALSSALTSAQTAIVFGSDIPELSGEVLAQACQSMAEGADAVIVPAVDGGYALLGLRRVVPSLFRGIDWGTGRVMAQTRERLRQLGWHWVELAPLWDLDRPEDLARFSALEDLPESIRLLLGGGAR